jgi:N-methylhydantoinase A
MAKAIRVMTVERGLDPRSFALLPFGGAGPMHACELAGQIGVREVIVPIAPGVTSALGTLFVDIVHDVARSRIGRLSEIVPAELNAVFAELEAETERALDDDLVSKSAQHLERSLDLRYLGQLKALTIPLPGDPVDRGALEAARQRFLDEYLRRYHYVSDDIEVELAVIRVRGRGLQERPELTAPSSDKRPEPRGGRAVRFQDASLEAAIFAREDLTSDVSFEGPLVVEQLDSTIVVPPGWELSVDARGNLRLRDVR